MPVMVRCPPAVMPLSHASMTEPLQTYAIAWPWWIEIATDAPPPFTSPA